MMHQIETRTIAFHEMETRIDDEGARHLLGVVIPWRGTYQMPNGIIESFDRGAFTKTLKEHGTEIPLYTQHESTTTLPVGTAVAWENTSEGLIGDFKMARTTAAEDVMSLAKDGHVKGLSVGFIPVRNRTERRGEQQHVIRLEARMDHVGFVRHPAYPDARVLAVRQYDPDDTDCAPRLARWRGTFLNQPDQI